MARQTRRRGFTLIEMSIVLVIVGLLLAGAVVGLKPVMLSSKISQANSKLDRIELALQAYIMQNGCLPCPADATPATASDAGWSQSNGTPTGYYGPGGPTNQPCAAPGATACAANQGGGTVVGIVPWNTLGLKDADTVDPWQDRISYAVTPTLAMDAGSSMVRVPPTGYPTGNLAVCSNSGVAVAPCTGVGSPQTSQAAYVLVSHGPDRAYAFSASNGAAMSDTHENTTANQQRNSPTDTAAPTVFHQDRAVPAETASYFDDIVRYKTGPALIQACGKNACGNPP